MKKFQRSDFNVKTAGLPEEQKLFMENILDMMCDVMNKSLEGVIDKDSAEKQFNEINGLLKTYDGEVFAQLKKDNEQLVEQVKNLGDSIDKMKKKGLSMDTINKFDEKLNEMLESDKFKDFAYAVLAAVLILPSCTAEYEVKIVMYVPVGQKLEILKYNSGSLAQCLKLAVFQSCKVILAKEYSLTAGYVYFAIHGLEERGFSRPYGSYYVGKLSGVQRECHIFQNYLGIDVYVHFVVIDYWHCLRCM